MNPSMSGQPKTPGGTHKLFTWFETGRPHIEPQPRQNVRKEAKS